MKWIDGFKAARTAGGLAGGCLLMGILGGCLATPAKVTVIEPTQVRPVAAAAAPINNGSLFQTVSYRPLYETPRARLVGDIITVNILEKVAAKQESSSTLAKAGTVSGSITAVPFMKAAALARLDAAGTSSNKFNGSGSTESTHDFSGAITATVIEVLRFSGQIDPLTIQPGNQVSSSVVANVRVEQRSRGAQGAAQGIGWLGRFFLSLSPI